MSRRVNPITVAIAQALLDGCTDAPTIVADTQLHQTCVYTALRRMVNDGWLVRYSTPGSNMRSYELTDSGLRGLGFILDLADGGPNP